MSLFLDLIFPKNCYYCGHQGYYFCPDCQKKLPTRPLVVSPPQPLVGLLSLFAYDRSFRRAILDLKYRFVTDLIPELSQLVFCKLNSDYPNLFSFWRSRSFVLVPVPLHPFRQNWRGFNQSALIASRLSQILQLDCQNLLIRRLNTPSQTSLSPSARSQNVDSAFSLSLSVPPPPANIILVDDVYTTGSTLVSAAKCFPSTVNVWGLTLAA